ncbi:MAG TPA: histidine phosphatase family protein [Burkholderiales bacterium]|nr:histidine phosphatase family protein [Burkholderiales bacterium]
MRSEAPIPLFAAPFCFLRHGESESNRLGLIAGSSDVGLTETGRAQARAAIERVRPLGVTRVFSSALHRAHETAAIIAGALALPHLVVPGLAERNWGELEGKPQALRRRGVTPPGAETLTQFVARTRAALAAIEAGGTPLIVAHSGTFRVLCRLLGCEAPEEAVANCHPVRFLPPSRRGEDWTLEFL